MPMTLRLIVRDGFMQRLKLWSTTPTPRNESEIFGSVTTYVDANGDTMGEHRVMRDAANGGWVHEYRIMSATAEADEAHSSIWV